MNLKEVLDNIEYIFICIVFITWGFLGILILKEVLFGKPNKMKVEINIDYKLKELGLLDVNVIEDFVKLYISTEDKSVLKKLISDLINHEPKQDVEQIKRDIIARGKALEIELKPKLRFVDVYGTQAFNCK